MLTTLLASSDRRRPAAGTLAASAMIHVLCLGTAAYVTTRAALPAEPPPAISLLFHPAPPASRLPLGAPPGAPPDIARVAPHIIDVAVTIAAPPEVEPRAPGLDDRLFSLAGVVSALATPRGSTQDSTAPFEAATVDRPIRLLGNPLAPRYPDALRQVGVEGVVTARFVVDTLGRVEPASVDLTSATHVLFADAVRAALARLRFVPAESGGLRVRQLVVQQFVFSLAR